MLKEYVLKPTLLYLLLNSTNAYHDYLHIETGL
jgi:hypothetical protein